MSRGARLLLLALLLVTAAGAAWVTGELANHAASLRTDGRSVAALLDRAHDAITDITAAQRAYVAPGQPPRPWADRVSELVQQVYRDTAALGERARSPETIAAIEAVEDAVSALVQTDTRIRERVGVGELAAASELIFGPASDHAATARQRLRALRAREAEAFEADSATAQRRIAAAAGITGGLLLLALLLVRTPRAGATDAGPSGSPPGANAAPPRRSAAATSAAPVDLPAVAEVCTTLSRMTTPDALPELLARSAAALGASGLIVWLDAGGRLTAAAGHGYDARVIARMGPIDRDADHATAEAWRSGRLVPVPAQDGGRGALVAPMFRPDQCIGVLAVEVPAGTERDAARQAAATMLAAQLAVTLAGREDF